MINIEKLQQYFENDTVFITEHATERFHQRGIRISDIKYAITNGEIIEQYPDDYPYFTYLSSPLFNKIGYNKIENQRLSSIRDTLLPKLMKGEIDVSKVQI